MRKHYYFRPSDKGFDAWDVDHLVEISRNLPEGRGTRFHRRSRLRLLVRRGRRRSDGAHPGAALAIGRPCKFQLPIILSADGREGWHAPDRQSPARRSIDDTGGAVGKTARTELQKLSTPGPPNVTGGGHLIYARFARRGASSSDCVTAVLHQTENRLGNRERIADNFSPSLTDRAGRSRGSECRCHHQPQAPCR